MSCSAHFWHFYWISVFYPQPWSFSNTNTVIYVFKISVSNQSMVSNYMWKSKNINLEYHQHAEMDFDTYTTCNLKQQHFNVTEFCNRSCPLLVLTPFAEKIQNALH